MPSANMQIAITGGSGFIGAALCEHLQAAGHRIVHLVRGASQATDETHCWWQPEVGVRQPEKLRDIDAVVHLAGRSIAARRWTSREKELIHTSRVDATATLCRDLLKLPQPPKTFLSGSAIGFYGDCGEEIVTEDHSPGDDFLARTCVAWEAASQVLQTAGMRVIYTRFGMVLSPHGGALAKMLPLFRRGLAGNLGSGRQYWSWVTREDAVRALEWLLQNATASGPFNVTAPQPVTNADFTRSLASALHHKPFLSVPKTALRLLVGEMADAALLSSCRAVPARLTSSGFEFLGATLPQAFTQLHVAKD